jgi:hypothetical protein
MIEDEQSVDGVWMQEPAAPIAADDAGRGSGSAAEKSVWILSYNNASNFGDRLVTHLAPLALPPNACVRWIHHKPWNPPLTGTPDLLILGGGGSLFNDLLTPDLLALLDRAPRKVGIFGTQYRDGFAPARMKAVVDRLDTWFARYQDDLELYGCDHRDARHLGDWLVTLFPMAEPTVDRTLDIGPEVMKFQSMDRLIQQIQSYRRVFSTRLHPLLCALTSANAVSYVEQRECGPLGPSGKFASMLRDVFGAAPPEKEWWDVDRAAVIAYKRQVARNVDGLKARFAELLA